MNPKYRALKFLVAIIAFSIPALILSSIPAKAVQYNISQITNNYYPNYGAKLNKSGQLVWIEDTGDTKIIFYRESNGTIYQIASYNSSLSVLETAINDAGQMAWSVIDSSTVQLFFKNLNNTPQLITQFNTDFPNGYIFKLNNLGYIVWAEGEHMDSNYNAIKLYDGASIVTIGNGRSPNMNNKGQIVWDESSQNIDIYNDGNITRIPAYSNYLPTINEQGKIAWGGFNGQSWEIFLYDSKTGSIPKQISNGHLGNISFWQINNTGQVVWSAGTDDTFNYYEVYVYDSVTNTTQAISQGHSSASGPQINDFGQVIWAGSDYNLYLSVPGNRNNPQVIGQLTAKWGYYINNTGQIAYMGDRGNSGYWADTEIYLATPQAINIPIPTAYPSIDKYSQAPDLWGNSLSFIKNNISSFSPDSQQFFNDNWKAFEKYLRKYGTKDRIRFWNYFIHDSFQNLGTVLSWGAIAADFGVSIEAGTSSFLLHIDKKMFFDILHLDNDSLLRAEVDVLTNAHIPTNPYSFVLSSGSLFSNLYAALFEQVAVDPPDPNFKEVFQCPIAITAPFNLPGVSSDMNILLGQHVGATYSTYYYLLGLTTSINRYSSALAASDAASAALQFEAFVAYLTLYDQSLFQQAELKKQFKQALINQGVPDVSYNKQVMLNIQNEIKQNGLPAEVITAFKNAGLTDQQIADLKQAAIDYVFPDSLPGSVYSSLSKGADLLLQTSSWVPPNPGVFLLLMD